MVKKVLLGLGLVAAVVLTGCAGSKTASATCAPVENGVGVCVEGKAVAWTAKAKPPHMHEAGGYYGLAVDLAKALGVKAEVSADKTKVTISGKAVRSTAKNAANIHEHEALVFVPIKEFAEAAGFKVEVDTTRNVINIHK